MMNPKKLFETSEMPLAAVLILHGYNIETSWRGVSGKIIFSFRCNEESDEIIRKYYDQELRVEPIAFFNSIKLVKSFIYKDVINHAS
jgi:hypothetical protein